MAEWISVNDRLPDKDEYILAFFECSNTVEMLLFNGDVFMDDIGFDYDIEYWHPLPKPPRTPQKEG